jgi:selenocysteine lyase/cysteine desulfurase
MPQYRQHGVSRREFARLAALSAWVPWALTNDKVFAQAAASAQASPLGPAPASSDESYWVKVRQQFVMPRDLGVMNAANLCPSSAPVLQALYDVTKDMDTNPSPQNRRKLSEGKEATRRALAEFFRVSPEEIVITRNTSEANNTVSTGVDLKAGDEVIIFADNHPSNNAAWKTKSERWGFAVKELAVPNPHPGAEYYIDAVTKAITPRTKLVAITHVTNTNGDLFPAKELCRVAREHGVMSHLDGAQSFGLLDVDLSDIQPNFYTGSGHKWPCGPKEVGVLFVNKANTVKLWPSIISAGSGPIGISKAIEGYGQRDEPAIMALAEALRFQTRIGRKAIESRSRELAQALMEGLSKIDGLKILTNRDPARSVATVRFQHPLNGQKLAAALYEKDRLAFQGGGNSLRVSPHFFNTHEEIDRTIAAVKRYVASGLS